MLVIIIASAVVVFATTDLCCHRTLSFFRKLVAGIVLYTSFVVLLFGNGPILTLYSRLLRSWNIGWRQASTLVREAERFDAEIKPVNYLAVGSSQTYVLYTMYDREHDDFEVLNIAGMNVLDMLLYQDLIKKKCGGNLLLMLSDFDLCRKPSVEGVLMSPPQSMGRLSTLVSELYELDLLTLSECEEYITAQLFPGFRYQYVCRGLLDKLFRKNMAFPNNGGHDTAADAAHPVMIKTLRGLSDSYLNSNMAVLSLFVSEMISNGVEVVIFEGEYEPSIMKENQDLRKKVRSRLFDFANNNSRVTYSSLKAFDSYKHLKFHDPYHLERASATNLANEIMESIRK